MKHIRYLKTAIPICEKPEALGLDYVVADSCNKYELPCTYCSALLMEWNKKSYEAELIVRHNNKQNAAGNEVNVKLFILGSVVFTSAFWIGFFMVLRWLIYG